MNIEINIQQTFQYLLISSFTRPKSIMPNVSTRRSGENKTNICIHQPRRHHFGRDGCPNLGVQEKLPKIIVSNVKEKRFGENQTNICIHQPRKDHYGRDGRHH